MKTITYVLLSILFPVFAAPVARFEKLSGDVQYKLRGGQWKVAKLGLALPAETELQTGPRAHAVVVFVNGSELALNAMTHVSLDMYGTGKFGSQTIMSLRNGRMIARIARTQNSDQRNFFHVRTPTVVAGVRGTIQEISYSNDRGCEIRMHESASDIVDNARGKSHVPQGGKSHVTSHETITADKAAMKDNTVILASSHTSTAGESAAGYSTGDFNFSSNPGDFTDLLRYFDKTTEAIFSEMSDNILTIEKL